VEVTAHQFNCSHAEVVHGGTHHRPKEVVPRASGGGRRPGRWDKWAGSVEWAVLAAGLVKGFRPNSRIGIDGFQI
jgi:hypothetical protein